MPKNDVDVLDDIGISDDEFVDLITATREDWGLLINIYVGKDIKKLHDLFDLGFRENKTAKLLRTNFWNQIAVARKTKSPYLPQHSVFTSICTKKEFALLLKSEYFCHYLLNPCADYTVEILDIIGDEGLRFYRHILALKDYVEVTKADGSVVKDQLAMRDKLALYNLKFKVLTKLEDRAFGETTKKIEANIKETIKDDRTPKYLENIQNNLSVEAVGERLKIIEDKKGGK